MNNNIPEIRFKGFTHAWVQRKLGDLADVRDGTHDSPKYYPTGYPLVTSKNLTDAGLDMSNVSLISAEDFERINKRSKVDIGDIIFGMIGTIGNPVLVDRCDFAIKNVALIKNSENIQNSLLLQLIKSPIFRKYVQNENVGNTQKFLGLNKIRDYNFLIPASTEQIAISNFFRTLDDTITLHQRKLDGLKELKRGYLQQLFPQTGECVPRVRFDGFSEPWQERKLGDHFSERSERSGEGELISVTINSGIMKARELDREIISSEDKSNYKTVKVGDIAYNSMRMWQGASGYSPYDGILSPAYTVITPNENTHSNFFAYAFKRFEMVQTFQKNSQGLTSDTWNLKYPVFSQIDMFSPSLDEQVKVADFLGKLDNQITTQQQKLSKLRQLKSAYLQKMFI